MNCQRVRKLEKTVWSASAVIHCSYNYSWTNGRLKRKGDGLWEQWYHPAGNRVYNFM